MTSLHAEVIAETHVVGTHTPMVLGEGGAEEALRRVRHALEEQDAERRAYNGLKSVGSGGVAPRPTLLLSGMDELVPSFRNGLPGAEESFKKYFVHPAVDKDLEGPEISALILKPGQLKVGQLRALLGGMARSAITPFRRRELIQAVRASLAYRLKGTKIITGPCSDRAEKRQARPDHTEPSNNPPITAGLPCRSRTPPLFRSETGHDSNCRCRK